MDSHSDGSRTRNQPKNWTLNVKQGFSSYFCPIFGTLDNFGVPHFEDCTTFNIITVPQQWWTEPNRTNRTCSVSGSVFYINTEPNQ